jgi:hypothetical protein
LLQAGAGVDTKRFLAIAGRDADRIEREGMGWANPLAWMVRAAIASIHTDMDRARHELTRHRFRPRECRSMPLPLAIDSARWWPARTAALVLRSSAWMAAQQVVNPERLTAMLTPGFH